MSRNGWTPERKARQSKAIRRWKPWKRSTGPRTAEGKAKSSMNSRRHGVYSQEQKQLKRKLRQMARLARAQSRDVTWTREVDGMQIKLTQRVMFDELDEFLESIKRDER